MKKTTAAETLKSLKKAYELLKLGQAIHVESTHGTGRVVGVGRRWIYIAGGRKCEARDVIDFWWDGV